MSGPVADQVAGWAAAHAASAPIVHSIVNLSALAPGRSVLAIRNARAASRLIAALAAEPEAREAATADQLQAALGAARLAIVERGQIADPIAIEPAAGPARTFPGASAAALLRGLLCAVQPDAAVGWWLFVVEPGGPQPVPPQAYRDLISAVVRWDGQDEDALDGTVFALACQQARPLQIVIDAPAAARPAADAIVSRHLALGTFEAAAAPEGRYLALLDAGDLVHPQHHALLRRALEGSSAAFALARGRGVRLARTDAGAYVTAKMDQPPLPADVAGLLRPGSLAGPAALFDRTRFARLDVNDPGLGPSERGARLARRLLSFTRPAIVAGVPAWERPERPALQASKELPLLLTIEELDASLAAAPAPSWLRYRVADAVSGALQNAGPLGPLLKSIATRWGNK